MNQTKNIVISPEIIRTMSDFVTHPDAETLAAFKNCINVLSISVRTYLVTLFCFKLERCIIEKTAARLENTTGEGSEHVHAILHLRNMVSTIDGFDTVPSISALKQCEEPNELPKALSAEFVKPIACCCSDTDAQKLYSKITDALGKYSKEKEMACYLLNSGIQRELLNSGIPLILDSLTQTEQTQCLLFAQISQLSPLDLPLYFDVLTIPGITPKAIMPMDIIGSEELEDVFAGIETLKTCYSKLPTAFYTLRCKQLLPALCIQVATNIATDIMRYGVYIPDVLEHKLNTVLYGFTDDSVSLDESEKPFFVHGDTLAEIMEQVYGMAIALDEGAAEIMRRAMFSAISRHDGLKDAVTAMAYYATADCVIASMFMYLQEAGYDLSDATEAKMMLYFAMRFCFASGDIAFWDSEAYQTLKLSHFCGLSEDTSALAFLTGQSLQGDTTGDHYRSFTAPEGQLYLYTAMRRDRRFSAYPEGHQTEIRSDGQIILYPSKPSGHAGAVVSVKLKKGESLRLLAPMGVSGDVKVQLAIA